MNDLRQNCELFYKEYLELQAEVDAAFQVQIQPIGTGTYEVRTAPSPEKMLRHKELGEFIKNNCKDCIGLEPGEWFEIEHRLG